MDIFRVDKKDRTTLYAKCKCSCGNVVDVRISHLVSGQIKSCGCLFEESVSGENNINWKGGITSELAKARNCEAYREWQADVYKKDWYTCQCCGCGKDLRAHHILNFSDHVSLRYDVENGITLCKDCHDVYYKGSFHNKYNTKNNTPTQLEEYINNKRKTLNIKEKFSIDEYLKGRILKPQI